MLQGVRHRGDERMSAASITKKRVAVKSHAPDAAREFLAAQDAYTLAAAPIHAGEFTPEQGAAFNNAREALYSTAYSFALSCAREVAGVSS